MLMRCRFNNCFLIPRASAAEKCNYTKPTAGHTDHSSIRQRQWRRHGGRGESFPPYGWTSKNYVMCVCAFIVMELHRITRQMHCKAVEQRATLIHRQYRDWGTSYSRPAIDPYLTSPPLQNPGGATGQRTTKQRTRVAHTLWAYYNCDTSTIRVRFDYDSSAIQHPTRSYVLSRNNEHVNSFPLL